MTLRELLAAEPSLFYPQTWYATEAFLDTPAEPTVATPKGIQYVGLTPTPGLATLPSAAQLAAAYLANPTASVWRWFHWTRDVDQHGNAVYVGGIGHDALPGFQIHRHLRITNRWGQSTW